MAKRALVVSGGGSKGAFAVGVLKHLARIPRGLEFNLVAGTSTGALIAPLVVTGEIDELERLYTSVKTRDVLRQRGSVVNMFRKASIHHSDGLRELIHSTLTADRVRAILESETLAFYTTVSLETGRVTYFVSGAGAASAPGDGRIVPVVDRKTLVDAILASANQPALMPAIPIRLGDGEREHFVDGGVREFAPIRVALENGATEIVAVVLNPESGGTQRRSPESLEKLPDVLLRAISLLSDEVGRSDVALARLCTDGASYLARIRSNARERLGLAEEEVEQLFPPASPFHGWEGVELTVVRPDEDLGSRFGISSLEFDPEKMAAMVAYGVEVAERELP